MENRGRFQAQGNNVEKSSTWDQDAVVSKQDGIQHIDNVEGQLTRNELRERTRAIQKAKRFVRGCSVNGVDPTAKSFFNSVQNREIRIDVEVNAGWAFITV